ncbi:MAG TPA: hypothetical protein VGD59_05630 [Acidisarcina sp.]
MASGQKVSTAAKALGIVEQTLANWVKADRTGPVAGQVERAGERGARWKITVCARSWREWTMERDIYG